MGEVFLVAVFYLALFVVAVAVLVGLAFFGAHEATSSAPPPDETATADDADRWLAANPLHDWVNRGRRHRRKEE